MKLRWYQREAIDALFAYWLANIGNPVIALPTGTGKSIVIAGFIQEALERFPGTRILVLTHVKELIGQNFSKLIELWPGAPAGINSAGLRYKGMPPRRDWGHQVIFAGIGSVAKQAHLLGHRHIVLIDECHTVSPKEKTQYRKCLAALALINPKMKVAGLTATPYRLGTGLIVEPGSVFTDICYDQTGMDEFNRFIDEGFLAPLIPLPMELHLDAEAAGVGMSEGDYKLGDLQKAFDKAEITRAAVKEIVRAGANRRRWLVFAGGVDWSDHVAAMFGEFGIPAVSIHSESEDGLREEGEAAFRAGEVRALVNNGIYTTGYDYSEIDLIAVLRNTVSPGLWVQMLGRGTRPVWPERDGSNWHLWPQGNAGSFDLETVEGRLACIATGPKRNCLVLDFARNTAKLGPINCPRIPQKKGKRAGQPPPAKICPNAICRAYNPTSAKFCFVCKTQFPEVIKIGDEAATDELIARRKGEKPIEEPIEEWFNVDRVIYEKSKGSLWRKQTFKAPPALKASYTCGVRQFHELVSLEHSGAAGDAARKWWIGASSGLTVPQSIEEALELSGTLRTPKRLRVWVNKYPSPQINYREY